MNSSARAAEASVASSHGSSSETAAASSLKRVAALAASSKARRGRGAGRTDRGAWTIADSGAPGTPERPTTCRCCF